MSSSDPLRTLSKLPAAKRTFAVAAPPLWRSVGEGIGYAPGLDAYLTASSEGGLHLLSLYENEEAQRADRP